MGFLDRVKRAVFGEPKVTTAPLTPSLITAGMAARSQDFILDRLEPSIKAGFDSIGQLLVNELHRSEERIIQHIDNVIQPTAIVGDIRINKEEVLEEFKKDIILSMKQLKDRLKVSTETLNYHLKNLEKEGEILHTGYGKYALIINKETLKENDSAETQAQNDSAEPTTSA